MCDENDFPEKATDPASTGAAESIKPALRILVTDADKYGRDITQMSNFIDGYIQQLTCELGRYTIADALESVPIADLGIINDMVHQVGMVLKGKYGFIPDFEHLPGDIKSKLEKGIYKIGESQQVSGNMRAVIVDENNQRIKDITLKRVLSDSGTMEATRSILNQFQMKQIYAKLVEIQELQSYQIDRDRDTAIVVPFLNARSYILQAQNEGTSEEKRERLKKATDELTVAINAVYTDMSTTSKHLARLTSFPVFQRPKLIRTYIGYLALDLQLVTRYVGIQMQVLDYLGDKVSSTQVLEGYRHVIRDFITKGINAKGQSAARLIHLHYPYSDSNRNWWYQFEKDMMPALRANLELIEEKEIYLVSAEDVTNENEC